MHDLYATQAQLLLDLLPGDADALNEAFVASQQALTSRAGDAWRQSSTRFDTLNTGLADLLRQRGASTDALLQADATVFATAARQGDQTAQDAARVHQARDIAAEKLKAVDRELLETFPGYARYLSPKRESMADTRSGCKPPTRRCCCPVLGESSALIWVVTNHEVRFAVSPVARSAIANLVERVRYSANPAVRNAAIRARGPLPEFDRQAARALYDGVIAPVESTGLLARAQHLILVPDGPLQSLPPHLLKDQAEGWLVERFAFTIAPSVAAYVAARRASARPSKASMAFLGIRRSAVRSLPGSEPYETS